MSPAIIGAFAPVSGRTTGKTVEKSTIVNHDDHVYLCRQVALPHND